MWKDVCHKCGQKIFNDIPKSEDVNKFIASMREQGYMIGFNTAGYPIEYSINPICEVCSDVEYKCKLDYKKKIMINKMKLLKSYHCPICKTAFDHKHDLINHLMDHTQYDLEFI